LGGGFEPTTFAGDLVGPDLLHVAEMPSEDPLPPVRWSVRAHWQFGQNGLVTSPLLRYSCEGAFEPTNRSPSGMQDGATLILCAVDRFDLLRRGLVAEEGGRMIGLAARVYLSSKLGVGPNADQAEVCEKFE
jgi:hypothetical protein